MEMLFVRGKENPTIKDKQEVILALRLVGLPDAEESANLLKNQGVVLGFQEAKRDLRAVEILQARGFSACFGTTPPKV